MNELQERILKSMDLTRQLSEEEIHEAIDLRMKEEISLEFCRASSRIRRLQKLL